MGSLWPHTSGGTPRDYRMIQGPCYYLFSFNFIVIPQYIYIEHTFTGSLTPLLFAYK